MAGMNVGMCCSGLEALRLFEKMHEDHPGTTPEEELRYERALNRFRYEVAKGYGLPLKENKAVKAWHKDFYTCAHCGAGANESAGDYCPNCGTRYLRNSYTESLLKEQAPDYEEWLLYMEEVSGDNSDVDERRHKEDEIIRTYRDGVRGTEREPAVGEQTADDGDGKGDADIPGLCGSDERQVPVRDVLD